ncbi:MAG TPA: PAS domain S-box protein, partial [Xanthomonadales bacterium]|nr:PAS domain S-box protein [Xanthomonadales bacterium]
MLAILGGALSSILGASVLVAWYTHNALLIQVSTAFVPMQFNTALGFLLSGLGLLGVSTGRHVAGVVCGIFVLFTGLLTLAEYLFGIDPGIDQLLLQHYITVQTSSPGRMAPDTAVCFSLTGTALIVLGTRANIWKPAMLAGVLGSLSAVLGFVVLTGYIIGLKTTYGSDEWTRMAVHTAGGFMLLGMGIVGLAWHWDISSHSRLPGWFPAPVGIGVAAVVISLWRSLAAQQAQLVSKYGISEDLSFINDLFLAVGIVLAITLALGVYLAQAARKQEREVKATNRRLTAEISEREWAEKEWGKLAQAVEQSPESIVITNLAAEIEYVNPAFTRLSGYSRKEVLGRNPRILQSGKTPHKTYTAMWNALQQNQSWTGEFCNKSKDGREYVEFVTIAPIRQANGAVSHYLAIKQDITEEKQLAEELDRHRHHLAELVEQRTAQLAEAQLKAEAANQAKTTFLANMSHEIRTPMNAIVGLTHLMQQANPTPEQAQWLDRINASTSHLLSIISDILDLAKIEAGKLCLEQSDFHLDVIFDQVRSLFGEQFKSRGLSFELDPGEGPRWLKGDPPRLRQALINYVGNAVKFTERGSIFLRARQLEQHGDEILLRF